MQEPFSTARAMLGRLLRRGPLGRSVRAVVLGALIALGLLGSAVLFAPTRNALGYGVLSIAFALRGMSFHAAALHIRADRISARAVEVDDRNGMVLAVRELDVAYDVRQLVVKPPRSSVIRGVIAQQPHLRVVVLPDGSINLLVLLAGARRAAATTTAASSALRIDFPVHIADGRLDVENPTAYGRPGRAFSVDGIALDITRSGERSIGTLRADYRAQGSTSHIHGTFVEDDRLRFAQADVAAARVAIAPPLDAFVSTPLFVAERGLADISVRAFDVGFDPRVGPSFEYGGSAQLHGGGMRIEPLFAPVRDAHGMLRLSGGYIGFDELLGRAAGLPVTASGTIRLAGGVRLALHARIAGGLEKARALFALTRETPMDGDFAATTRIAGPLGDIHAAVDFRTRGLAHIGDVPLENAVGWLYYHDGHVTVPFVRATYAGGTVGGGGDFDVAAREPTVQVVAEGDMPASAVPVVANLNRGGAVQASVALDGPVSSPGFEGFARTQGGVGASATLDLAGRFGARIVGSARVAWPRGDVGLDIALDRSVAPLVLHASIVAQHAPLRLHGGGIALPGLTPVVAFPESSGILDGVAVMRGSPDDSGALQTGISMDLRGARIAGARVDQAIVRAHGAGPLVSIDRIAIEGRDVRLVGSGAAFVDPARAAYALALGGDGQAWLGWLPQRAGFAPNGSLAGDFETVASNRGWALAARSLGGDASFDGRPLRNISLVAMKDGLNPVRIGVRASALGGAVAVVGTLPTVAVFARGIEASALGGPLSAGTLTALGSAGYDARDHPTFNASLALAGGRFRASPLAGDADIAYAAGTMNADGRIDVEGSRAQFSGTARGVVNAATFDNVALDVRGSLVAGDASVLRPYLPALATLAGTVDATATVRGSVGAPQVEGRLTSGAATIRGVAITQTRADFTFARGVFSLRDGRTQLGSSRFEFEGTTTPSAFKGSASSNRVDLSDFNDFFNGLDALDGVGRMSVAFALAPGRASTTGSLEFTNAAVAGIPLGSVSGRLGGAGDTIHVALRQRGKLGSTDVTGDVTLHAHVGALPDPNRMTFDVLANARGIDLSGLSRLTGLEDFGVQGSVDTVARATGTLAKPSLRGDFAAHNASIHNVSVRVARGMLLADRGGFAVAYAQVALPFADASGNAGWTRLGAMRGNVRVNIADLSKLSVLTHMGTRLTGSATGTLTIGGNVRSPTIQGAFQAGPGTIYGVAFDRLIAQAAYSKDELTLGDTSVALAGGRGTVTLAGTLPLQLRPFGLGPANRPIGLTVRVSRVKLDALNPALAGVHTISGSLDARATVSGNAGRPELAGDAQLRDATYESKYERTPLRAVRGDLSLAHDAVSLSGLSGTIGSGSFMGSGVARVMPAAGARKSAGLSYDARVALHNAPIDVPDWISGNFSGEVSLTNPSERPSLAGDVTLRDATIPVPALYRLAEMFSQTSGPPPTQHIPGVPPVRPGHMVAYGGAIYTPGTHLLKPSEQPIQPVSFLDLPTLDLELRINAQDVRVRGGPLDLLANGRLAVNGSVQNPQLDGEFIAKRGQVSGYGRTFRIERGVLSFAPDEGVLPQLYARAVTNIAGDQITLDISGRIDRLDTQFSSSNGETPEQILATIITGAPTQELSESSSGQALTAQAQDLFSNELTRAMIDPFSNALAESLNLEEVSFSFSPQGQLVVNLRKYVTPTVAVLYATTTAAPLSQAYGISYRVRDYAALELASTVSSIGFANYLLNVRLTFK